MPSVSIDPSLIVDPSLVVGSSLVVKTPSKKRKAIPAAACPKSNTTSHEKTSGNDAEDETDASVESNSTNYDETSDDDEKDEVDEGAVSARISSRIYPARTDTTTDFFANTNTPTVPKKARHNSNTEKASLPHTPITTAPDTGASPIAIGRQRHVAPLIAAHHPSIDDELSSEDSQNGSSFADADPFFQDVQTSIVSPEQDVQTSIVSPEEAHLQVSTTIVASASSSDARAVPTFPPDISSVENHLFSRLTPLPHDFDFASYYPTGWLHDYTAQPPYDGSTSPPLRFSPTPTTIDSAYFDSNF